jgi:hypothetical protein
MQIFINWAKAISTAEIMFYYRKLIYAYHFKWSVDVCYVNEHILKLFMFANVQEASRQSITRINFLHRAWGHFL